VNISFLKVYASILCKNPANMNKPTPEKSETCGITARKYVPGNNKYAKISQKNRVFVLIA